MMTLEQFIGDFQFNLLGFQVGLLFMEVLLFVTSLFMMLLILVQRGKGGGLTGALGGMGGQSAFGSKAGDAFTKITIITAVIWITLCMVTIAAFNPPPRAKSLSKQLDAQSGTVSTADEDATSPADGDPAAAASDSASDETANTADDASSEDSEAAESGGIQLDLSGNDSDADQANGPESTENPAPADDK
jgi:preprotein translocase subunit SecG